jgi:phosphorylcholine metabolism protein LicD
MATINVEKSDIDQLVEFTKNTHWLVENIDNLRSKYHDRYVAVLDSGNRILDAHTKKDLISKIIQLGRNPDTSAIDFVTLERYLLIL